MRQKSEERITERARVRRRGGQPGNTNAWKHGRYARHAIAERMHVRELLRAARRARKALLSADR